jgi:hypothetical protein
MYVNNTMPKHVYTVKLGDLAEVPGSPYAYWAPKTLRELFQKYPPLDRDVAGQKDKPKIADVKQGLATGDDLRFTRFWWEVDTNIIATSRAETYHKKWVPYVKGGNPFYYDIQLVVNWLNNGEEIRNFEKAVIRNGKFYFREGLAWALIAKSSESQFDMFLKPAGTIHDVASHSIFLDDSEKLFGLLGVFNSEILWRCFQLLDPTAHNRHIGYVSKLPIVNGVLNNQTLGVLATEAYTLLSEWDTGNEPSTQFIMPWLLQVWSGFSHDWKPVTNHPLAKDFQWADFKSAEEIRADENQWNTEASIITLAEECVQRELKLRKRLDEIQNAIDDEVYRIYDISEEDRKLIEEELVGEGSGEKTESEDVLPAEEHIKRLLSYFAHEVMKEDEDGIVPVSDMFLGTRREPGMATRAITKLRDEFGDDNLDRIETELTKVLKMSIEDWYAKEFFAYHATLYRLRPVIWQLSSEGKAFSCFLYWHKLDADTIPKVRQLYLKPVFEAAKMEVETIKARLSKVEGREKRQVESEFESVLTKYEELKAFDAAFTNILKSHKLMVTSKSNWVMEKVAEITEQGYRPERDYGVRVNIEPLKQAGLMPKTADRVKG